MFKIRVPKEMKDVLTVSEMVYVREMQENAKEEDVTLEYYCKIFAEILGEMPSRVKIFEPHAEIAKNCRVKDRFVEGSGDLDIWVECYIFGDKFCGKVGACITDLIDFWDTDDKDKRENIKQYIFKVIYKRVTE